MTLRQIDVVTPVRLEVRLELKDVLRANYEIFFRRMHIGLPVYLILALGALAVLRWSGAPVTGPAFGLLAALFVTLPLLALGYIYWSARQQFLREGADRPVLRYCLRPDGLDVGSDSRAGWLPWWAFQEVAETPSSFVLHLPSGEHYVLPKRCFQEPGEIEGARKLLLTEAKAQITGKGLV